MQLEGIHHITCITAEAQPNVDFYAGVLGLRLVKKTVNQDEPSVYHLFYGDEDGQPGLDLTFFEFPGVPRGRAGDGMIHTIVWRVSGEDAIGFWEERLTSLGVDVSRLGPGRLRFEDPEGLAHELAVVETSDEPLVAEHPDIPRELALQGFEGVRAYTSRPEASSRLLEALGFQRTEGERWEVRGEHRGGRYEYEQPPPEHGLQGAGTVHHIAFASTMEDHEKWRARVAEGGGHATQVIDRFYFRSIYFREPSGVLFEIATIGPGFAVDEDPAHLGEGLALPPRFEPYREEIEARLRPVVSPRRGATAPPPGPTAPPASPR